MQYCFSIRWFAIQIQREELNIKFFGMLEFQLQRIFLLLALFGISTFWVVRKHMFQQKKFRQSRFYFLTLEKLSMIVRTMDTKKLGKNSIIYLFIYFFRQIYKLSVFFAFSWKSKYFSHFFEICLEITICFIHIGKRTVFEKRAQLSKNFKFSGKNPVCLLKNILLTCI